MPSGESGRRLLGICCLVDWVVAAGEAGMPEAGPCDKTSEAITDIDRNLPCLDWSKRQSYHLDQSQLGKSMLTAINFDQYRSWLHLFCHTYECGYM